MHKSFKMPDTILKLITTISVTSFATDLTKTKLPDLQHLVRLPDTTTIDSSTITTSDSARFILPVVREVLDKNSTPIQVVPRCETDSITIFVRHSFDKTDTLAHLYKPPYQTGFNYATLPDQDQIHLQFGYLLYHPQGKTIVSGPLPHRWAIDRSPKKSRKKYHCKQIISPDTIIIDGKLNEWSRTRRGRIDENGVFALRWTSAFLYFAAELRSRSISPSDFVELHLDPYYTRSTYAGDMHRSIRFGPRSRSFCIVSCKQGDGYEQCDSITSLLNEGFVWRVALSDSGYTIEAAIPFYGVSDLDFPKLRFGMEVSTRSGDAPAHFSSWANSGEFTRYNPSEWGTIVLHQAMLPLKITLFIVVAIIGGIVAVVLFIVLRHFFASEKFEREDAKGGSETLQHIQSFVTEHLHETTLTIEMCAKSTALPASEIESVLREELDSSFTRFVDFIRINHVKKLLWDFSRPIEEIARRSGFSSTDDLTEKFRFFLRTDPESFRTKIKEIASDDESELPTNSELSG